MAGKPPPLKITITPGAGKAKKPPKTPAQKAADAAATARAKAASPAYLSAQADLAAATAAAKLDNHAYDPWVVPVIKNGEVIGFRYVAGVTAPKNALRYGGEPLTKSTLTSVWSGGGYNSAYQQFTGRVARPKDIVAILKKGMTVFGMQAQLAKLPGFEKSPIYLSQSADINAAAQAILGTNASKEMIRNALAQNWDSATVQQHLRALPAYLKGPEYLTNKATMKDAYQQIYGAPGAEALQSISEAAANGWTTVQFADYLRSQPQYSTSVEYQSNAVNFLEAMGLLTGSRATLTPGATGATGGTAVTDAKVVPGTAKPLTPVLPFTPTLPGAAGVATKPASPSGLAPTSTPVGSPDYGPPDTWMREPWVTGEVSNAGR